MSSDSEAPTVDVERCLDSLATALRTWGRLAFDTSERTAAEAKDVFEAWARHILLATPPPEGSVGPAKGQARDWVGLEDFVKASRKDESEYTVSTLEDLRQVVWIFVEAFGRSMTADQKSDNRVTVQLERLRDAAKGEDTAGLKSEAMRSASVIEGAISVRVARYQSHIEKLSGRLEEMASELVESRRRVAIDPLTGVYNRASFDEQMNIMVNLGRFVGDAAIVFMIDIDHFKWANDKFGHQVGDDLLRRVGRGLQQALRRQADFVARYGGDEFVAIVHGGTEQHLVEMGERILYAVRNVEVKAGGESVRVSASVGAARLRQDDDSASWLKRADDAMYQAKQAGRDRLVVSDGTSGSNED